MDLKQVRWEDMDWSHLSQEMDSWQDLMKTVMNLQVL